MANLIGMPRAAWRRQPQNCIDIDPVYLPYISAVSVPGYAEIISGNTAATISGGYRVGAAQYGGMVAKAPIAQIPGFVEVATNSEVTGDFGLFVIAANSACTLVATHTTTVTGELVECGFNLWTTTFGVRLDGNLGNALAYNNNKDLTLCIGQRIGNQIFNYVNGVKSAGATTGTRTGTITSLIFGRNKVNNSEAYIESYVYGVLKRTLPDALILDWQKNPWQLFKPRIARFISIPSAAVFKPYWARSRSLIIGSGV